MSRPPKIHIESLSEAEHAEMLRTRQRVVDWARHIEIDPAIAFGKPRVRGTRIAAEFILDLYAAGWTDEQVLKSYPTLTRESIRAVFAYAAECVSEKQISLRSNAPNHVE